MWARGPRPRPHESTVRLSARAALIATALVQNLLQRFNKLILQYGTAVGTAREMDKFVIQHVPDTVTTAAQAAGEAKKAGQAVLDAGTPLIDQMRVELGSSTPTVSP